MSSSFRMVCPGSQNLRTGPVICLHALTGLILCKLLADILMSVGTVSLPPELQQETGGWNLNFSLFSWPISAERKRLFHLFLANPKALS